MSAREERIESRREIFRRLGASLAFRLLMIALILYALYHCVAAFSDRVVTDVITLGTHRTTISGEAVLFRDEVVLTEVGGNHLCSYPNENGAKVNASTTLCELYLTVGDEATRAQLQATLQALDRQIALAERLPIKDNLASLPSLRLDVSEQLLINNRLATTGGAMQSIHAGSYELLLSINRIEALTGKGGGSAALLSSLRAERQRLLLSAGYMAKALTVADLGTDSAGGYFYYADTVDGYEEIFSQAALADMTGADYERLLQLPRRTYGSGVTVAGKLVSGFYWSIVLPVPSDQANKVEVGDSYRVIFNDEGGLTLSMRLDRIIPTTDDRSLLVLTTSEMPKDFSYTRFAGVSLILEETEGYRVPETALVEQDGRKGVYILSGGRVTFRAIEIVSRGEGFVLAYVPTQAQREDEQNETYHYDRYLDVRDVVITDGRDLYDGKYIE